MHVSLYAHAPLIEHRFCVQQKNSKYTWSSSVSSCSTQFCHAQHSPKNESMYLSRESGRIPPPSASRTTNMTNAMISLPLPYPPFSQLYKNINGNNIMHSITKDTKMTPSNMYRAIRYICIYIIVKEVGDHSLKFHNVYYFRRNWSQDITNPLAPTVSNIIPRYVKSAPKTLK